MINASFDAEREAADSNIRGVCTVAISVPEFFGGTGEGQAVRPSNRPCLRFGFLRLVSSGTALLERTVKIVSKQR